MDLGWLSWLPLVAYVGLTFAGLAVVGPRLLKLTIKVLGVLFDGASVALALARKELKNTTLVDVPILDLFFTLDSTFGVIDWAIHITSFLLWATYLDLFFPFLWETIVHSFSVVPTWSIYLTCFFAIIGLGRLFVTIRIKSQNFISLVFSKLFSALKVVAFCLLKNTKIPKGALLVLMVYNFVFTFYAIFFAHSYWRLFFAVLVVWNLARKWTQQHAKRTGGSKHKQLVTDDISKLSETAVSRIFYPRTTDEIKQILKIASRRNKKVSVRGQSHTMGGHTIAKNGYVIDMRFYNSLTFCPSRFNGAEGVRPIKDASRADVSAFWSTEDKQQKSDSIESRFIRSDDKEPDFKVLSDLLKLDTGSDDWFKEDSVVVQPGATWTQIIYFLNKMGLSPFTMQSYCSFSVGGTLSVNAHGITNDFSMAESVLSMRVLRADGKIVVCSRNHNQELFSLVLGGYGLFGVILEVRLRVSNNVKIDMEMVRCNYDNFRSFYDKVLLDNTIDVKLARIDLTNPLSVSTFLFRRINNRPTVSNLSEEPRSMNKATQLLYKWLVPRDFFQRFRHMIETFFQQPLDWKGDSDRNLLMYESAVPLANLYQPLIKVDDTFILQEFFIPTDRFEAWMAQFTDFLRNYNSLYPSVNLLNVTIRFVLKDNLTFLKYAPQNMFAFVLYIRIPRKASAQSQLHDFHQRLSKLSLSLDGTFYLPYRHHYDFDQMSRAYPMIGKFFEMKHFYDPNSRFTNLWFDNYHRLYTSSVVSSSSSSSSEILDPLHLVGSHNDLGMQKSLAKSRYNFSEDDEDDKPKEFNRDLEVSVVESRRHRSFAGVFYSRSLRYKFEKFIDTVFHFGNKPMFLSRLSHTLRLLSSESNDEAIFSELQRAWPSGPIQKVHLFNQLGRQRNEITRQTTNVIKALNYEDKIHNYVSIGDSGLTVASLKKYIPITGTTYVLHDKYSWKNILFERGTFLSASFFVSFDYDAVHDVPITSGSIDFVSCNMGLHHFEQATQLKKLLEIVWRMLAPGGIFIFREHDARPDLIPLLDIAHEVFNVVTGVSSHDNAREIRAFRTIEEWCKLLTDFGFENTFAIEQQYDDPTEDVMLCFRKPFNPTNSSTLLLLDPVSESGTLSYSTSSSSASSFDPDLSPSSSSEIIFSQGDNNRAKLDAAVQDVVSKWRRHIPVRDSTYSEFAFNEWAIVDFVKLLGRYLENQPWYRFPYDDWIVHYWTKFVQSVSDTASNRSTSAALTNDGFLTDIIIGIITTLFLAQMQILALPFRWLLGSSYSDSNFMFLVVRQNLSENDEENNEDVEWRDVHEEIECIDQRLIFESETNIEGSRSSGKRAVAKLWLLKLPRYIGFEKSLVALSREALNLRIKILEINGMSDSIQMRLTTPSHSTFSFNQVKGGRLRFHSTVPGQLSESLTDGLFSVPVDQILSFISNLPEDTPLSAVYDF